MIKRRMTAKLGLIALATLAMTLASPAKSCLWKVSSGSGTLYLQGSIHLLKESNYPLAPAIENAYAASGALVLEVDMGKMATQEIQQRIMTKAALPPPLSLDGLLDAKTHAQLAEKCAAMDIPIKSLESFKPWYATMTLMLVKLQRMGFDPQYGLDKHFHDKAVASGKPIIGLESIEFQIDLFDNLADANPDAWVAHALTDLDLLENDMAELDLAWTTGDIETIGRLIAKGFADYPELHATFVLERNKKWAAKLETLLSKKETCMVVVGAGHLPGQGGLLELLREKGCSIEQL